MPQCVMKRTVLGCASSVCCSSLFSSMTFGGIGMAALAEPSSARLLSNSGNVLKIKMSY